MNASAKVFFSSLSTLGFSDRDLLVVCRPFPLVAQPKDETEEDSGDCFINIGS